MSDMYIVENVLSIDKNLYEKALKSLSKDRKEKTLKYKRYEDRCRSVVAGILAKYMINIEYKVPVKNVEIGILDDGKPYYEIVNFNDKNDEANQVTKYNNIEFNISHSGDYVVGIIDECDVVIDVEKISRYDEKIAARFFCKREYEFLKKSDKQKEDFIRFWTIKEAYIKYLSLGMKKGLDTFYIDIINEKEASIYDKQLDKIIDLVVYSYRIDESFYMSCVSKSIPIVKKISVQDLIENFLLYMQ